MRNLFNFRKKKDGTVVNNVKPLKSYDAKAFNMWCEDTGATKGYVKFKRFEDPNIVDGAVEFDIHLKKEIIIAEQQKVLNY